MEFELTQGEISNLQSCAEQMVFVSDLCCMAEGQRSITIEGLGSFLDAQIRALKATINAAEERHVAQLRLVREEAKATMERSKTIAISTDLLVRVMQACSGAIQDDEAIVEINNELYDATVVTQGKSEPLSAFYMALRIQGYSINFFDANGMMQTTIKRVKPMKSPLPAKPPKVATRKRERLVGSV